LHLAFGTARLPLRFTQKRYWDEDTNIFPDLFRTAVAKINPDVDDNGIDRLLAEVKLLLSTRPEINVIFGKQNRMRCKAPSAPQCEHCKQEPTQQRAGSGSQNTFIFG
jgi:hypothetical protein